MNQKVVIIDQWPNMTTAYIRTAIPQPDLSSIVDPAEISFSDFQLYFTDSAGWLDDHRQNIFLYKNLNTEIFHSSLNIAGFVGAVGAL